MQQHGPYVDLCDICGEKYDDHLDVEKVTAHRKLHQLDSQEVTSSDLIDMSKLPDGGNSQIVLAGEDGGFVILQGSGQEMAQRVDAQFEPQASLDGEYYISESGNLEKLPQSSKSIAHSRVITVQDSNGLVYNVQIDENQHNLSSLIAEGGVEIIDSNSAQEYDSSSLQYVVLDPSSC